MFVRAMPERLTCYEYNIINQHNSVFFSPFFPRVSIWVLVIGTDEKSRFSKRRETTSLFFLFLFFSPFPNPKLNATTVKHASRA